MIRDAKGGLFASAIDWYIARKVRRAFRGVWVRGELPSAATGLIAYLNHSSFWDGFLVHQLGKLAGWDAYAVMEEENLARYRFHTRIGAFSVRRGDPRSAVETLRYAKTVLERPNACVSIFPQGELRQGALGPLSRGVEVLARSSQRLSVPIALRYAFFEHEHPDVLVEVGTPHPPGPLEVFERQLEAAVERVQAARSTEGFTLRVAGRRGVQERWDTVRRLPSSTHGGAQTARS
jgi:1-acyl-sn-glycerol-3-phosphate acyltransferase